MNDLNAKVAKILGWFISPGVGGPLWHRPGDVRSWPEPQFDTDYALLPEMLAWLKGRCSTAQRIALTDIEFGCWLAGIETWDEMDSEYSVSECHGGKSIPEAVARLVVAVAEEKP